ncbi:hypothetical protein G6F55_006336 [Rhizopus delemar]|nr:hypothetical protein G6F43_005700 [Rhizopus delemar]KAG1456737.1 hypothetical protein G6F55_006336 [Rhizopus delemar]
MVHKSLLEAVQCCDKYPYTSSGTSIPFQYQNTVLGHILPDVFSALSTYNTAITPSPFVIQPDSVQFASWVDSFEKRTEVFKALTDHWRATKMFAALAGWRDELYPVYGQNEIVFVIERAASPLFGVATFGVHLNAYVVDEQGSTLVWVARRAKTKQTWPGLLDNCVAGGISYQYKIKDTVVKECDEEASIPYELASKVRSANAITYYTYSQHGLQPETQYIFDLELPRDFVPTPRDGEVDCFYLWPLDKIKETILNEEWKPNCAAVMIEFMQRHGFITPDDERDYIQISYHLHRKLEFPTPHK